MENEILLSVVIISRNIEKYIGQCIESVLIACAHIENKEIILIDSASNDNTVEIAKRYPIKILRIDNSAPLSASAGRYLGLLHAKGRYIYFHDGDSLVYDNWFNHALPVLESYADIAAVVGIITQEYYNNRVTKKWIRANKNLKIGPVLYYESFILIKREAIENVGSFNPWLKFMEEGELSARIINAGFKINRLPFKVAHHLGYEGENFNTELKRKITEKYALGQILRYSLNDKRILYTHIKDEKFSVALALLSPFVLLFLFLGFLFNNNMFLFIPLLFLFLVYAWILMEKKDIILTLSHIISISLRWPFIILGFLKYPRNPSEYPDNVVVIKK